jgi:hypothetical protein
MESNFPYQIWINYYSHNALLWSDGPKHFKLFLKKKCTNKRLIFNATSVLFWHHSFFLMLEVTDTRVPDSSYYPPSNQNSINPTASCISYFQASMWDEYKKQRFNHYLWKWEAKSNEKKVILRFVNACWQGGNHVLTKKA